MVGYRIRQLRKLSMFRFISCGQPKIKAYAIQELHNVFDGANWLMIFISSLSIAFTLRQMSADQQQYRLSVLSHLISPLKVLLEQGDPFSSSSCKLLRLRFVLGPFLLVGIVLSNAYKNQNVYNMIAPRLPLPYNELEDLVRDKFHVFGRLVVLPRLVFSDVTLSELSSTNLYDMQSVEIFNISSESGVAFKYAVGVWSEFRQLLDSMFGIFASELETYPNETVDVFDKVKNLTKLAKIYPPAMQMYEGITQSISSLHQSKMYPNMNIERVLSLLLEIVMKREEEMLMKFMGKCDRAALILPEYLAGSFQKKLKRGGRHNAHLGTGSLGLPDFADNFFFSGNVPPGAIKRYMATKEAGLWDWWMELIRGFVLRSNTWQPDVRLEKPSMSGNVLVVFGVLFYGLSMASIVMIFEARQTEMWKKVVKANYLTRIIKKLRMHAHLGRVCRCRQSRENKNLEMENEMIGEISKTKDEMIR